MKSLLLQSTAICALGLLAAPGAFAASFTINGSSTSAQTLGSGSGQTGLITLGSTLNVSASAVAVTITGNNASLTNLGTLEQTGTGSNAGRAIRDNTGVSNLVVTNGSATNATATIQTTDGDVIQMNKAAGGVSLYNYGQMISYNASAGGAQVIDFNAITTGANSVTNYSTGVMHAYEADAVRPGVNGTVNNYGKIIATTTTGSSSDGIDAQTNSGVQINNYAGGLVEGGRHGITGGAVDAKTAFTMSVTNQAGATIQGDNGSGVNIDGFNAKEIVTVVNHGVITGNGVTGDGDGVDVDGLVNITNTGTIRSLNAVATGEVANSEGLSVGGGTITNSGTIRGSVAAGNLNAIGRGITLTGNDITTGPYAGGRDPIYGDASVTNKAGGQIVGDSDAAIAVVGAYASGHSTTIDNQAGATLKGGGTARAAVDATQSFDKVTIVNAGTIDGSSSGKAIALGAGDNTVILKGGSVLGDIAGGVGGTNALSFDPGAGQSFRYSGAISQFATTEVKSGTAALSGSVAGPVSVDAGATLAPGADGIGSLDVGDLVLKAGSTLSVDLDPAHGLSDRLNVTGSVSLNGADLLLALLAAPTTGQRFDILLNDGSDAISGLFGEGRFVNATFGGRVYSFRIDYGFNADGGLLGNDIALTATPEPTTWAMMLIGFAGLGWAGRRAARSSAAVGV